MIVIDVEVPFASIHHATGTDPADLLEGIGNRDAVHASVRNLLHVIAVGSDANILDNLIGCCRVEVDGLSSLCGVVTGVYGRRVVGGVPAIVDAPPGLRALGGINRRRIIRVDRPGVVANVDRSVRRLAAKRRVEVEVGALIAVMLVVVRTETQENAPAKAQRNCLLCPV